MSIEILDLSGIDNDALIHFAKQERALCPGSSLAAQKGSAWASLKLTAIEWKCPALEVLDQRVRRELPYEGRIEWWFVALDPLSSIADHDHHQALWTGVYYPRSVDFQQGGELYFPSEAFAIAPYTGCLLLFPPDMEHSVKPTGPHSGTRWSLAFNVMAEEF